MMHKTILLTILLLLSISICKATTYFISSTIGSDSNSGLSKNSPWKTLDRLKKLILSNGDTILLKNGDIFQGNLRIQGTNIKVGAYSTGARPIINGGIAVLNNWQKTEKSKIWKTFVGDGNIEISNLMKGKVKMEISRFPKLKERNNGYLNFEKSMDGNTIEDSELVNYELPNDMDIVIRASRFRLVRTNVQNVSGATVKFDQNKDITRLINGYGYFFVNHYQFLSNEHEWAYDSQNGILFIYSNDNPNKHQFTYTTDSNPILIYSSNNISLEDIEIQLPGKLGLKITNSNNINIKNVLINNSGGDGVLINKSDRVTLEDLSINYTNGSGIVVTKSNNNVSIAKCNLSNIGNSSFAKGKTFIGIDCSAPNSRLFQNTVIKSGYSGILSAGQNNLIKRNIIDSACLFLDDNGAIYTNNNIANTAGTIIEKNFISNTIGELMGAPASKSYANGIYLDNGSHDVLVRSNSVSFVNGSGIFLNRITSNIRISDNILFNNKTHQVSINNYSEKTNILTIDNYIVNTTNLNPHIEIKGEQSLTNNILTIERNNVIGSKDCRLFTLRKNNTSKEVLTDQSSALSLPTSNMVVESDGNPFAYMISNKTNTIKKIYCDKNWDYIIPKANFKKKGEEVSINAFSSIVIFSKSQALNVNSY